MKLTLHHINLSTDKVEEMDKFYRTVLGLGCSTAGDVIGLSPGNSDDPDDWNHA